MNIEVIPRIALTHTGALVAGFIFSAWCYRSPAASPTQSQLKSGFTISIPIKSAKSVPTTNHQILPSLGIAKFLDESRQHLCAIKIEGVQVRQVNNHAQIHGELKQLSSLALIFPEIESGKIIFLPPEKTTVTPPCAATPRVEYGRSL